LAERIIRKKIISELEEEYMWLFTKYGFYSIVRKPFSGIKETYEEKPFQVRSRIKDDLNNLKKAAEIESEVIETKNSDYRYRMFVGKEDFLSVMNALVDSVDYPNFKNEVAKHRDQRHKLHSYHDIWRLMYNIQK